MGFLDRIRRLEDERKTDLGQGDDLTAGDPTSLTWLERQRRELRAFDGTIVRTAQDVANNRYWGEYVAAVMKDFRTQAQKQSEGTATPAFTAAMEKRREKLFRKYGKESRRAKGKKK